MFNYEDLCEKPLGAADFIALTNTYHTLAVNNVPVVTAANRAAAYRLVTLVDVLYEHKTRVVMSAQVWGVWGVWGGRVLCGCVLLVS